MVNNTEKQTNKPRIHNETHVSWCEVVSIVNRVEIISVINTRVSNIKLASVVEMFVVVQMLEQAVVMVDGVDGIHSNLGVLPGVSQPLFIELNCYGMRIMSLWSQAQGEVFFKAIRISLKKSLQF